MANQKIKKQVSIPQNKPYNNKNSVNKLKQKSKDYSGFFIPFIIIFTAIIFANTLGNDFVDNWDDNTYILDNNIIRNLNWISLKEIFSSFYVGCYQPITMLSFILEYKIFGLNPFAYHFTNYFFHIINVILVYIFLKRFTGKSWVAAISSLFFAIHPMHVESVAWVSERKDVLYSFFFLLSLNSYSKYLLAEKKINFLIWSFIWFFLSLMSKPAAVCLPLVLILMDYYHNKKLILKTFVSKIHFFILSLLFGILTIYSQKSNIIASDITPDFNIIERFILVSYSTVYYIFMVFAPFKLSALHFFPLKNGSMLPIEYYLALPALLLIVWGVIKSGSFKHELVFGLLFYLVTIALVLQIIPAGQAIVSERYSYIPYIGIFFIFGQFFSYIKEKKFSFSGRMKSVINIVILVLVFLYSFLTYERNKLWKNGIVLFTDVIEKYPEQEYGWYSRGFSKDKSGDYNGAIADFNIAIKLKPDFAKAYYNRGTVYNKINKLDSAIADFSVAIKLKPDFYEALNNRGTVYNTIKKYENAIVDFNTAIKLKPDFSEAYNNLGFSLANLNRIDESLKNFSKAIEFNPQYAKAYNNRGLIKFNLNDKTGACCDWLLAKKYGYEPATIMLEKYCK